MIAGLRVEIWTRDPPVYEAGVLTIQPRRSVFTVSIKHWTEMRL
jgi:hypothetical protein